MDFWLVDADDLIIDGRGNRFPRQPDPAFDGVDVLFENRTFRCFFLQGPAVAAFQLEFPVGPGQFRIPHRAAETLEPDFDILIRARSVQKETGIQKVSAVLHPEHQRVVILHSGDDGEERLIAAPTCVDRHRTVRKDLLAVLPRTEECQGREMGSFDA